MWFIALFGQLFLMMIFNFFCIFLWMIATKTIGEKFLKKPIGRRNIMDCLLMLAKVYKIVFTFSLKG
jgi:hypothetical protein